LAKGDFFTTWANRFDSDMPITSTEPVTDDDIFPLGNGQISVISLSGHSSDGLGYYVKEKDLLITGPILPRADRPTRWDLPTGCLPDVIQSLKKISKLNLETLIPMQGPAIKEVDHIKEVLERHIDFFEDCVSNDGQSPKSWARPAQTAIWMTPHPPWPLTEREDIS
jgi:glyoxylase-like metal-dependent hydrolase (beta-lactamase superfamily II)